MSTLKELFPKTPTITCGGAPIDAAILRDLDGLGLRVYEGYGLSENSSVVSLNSQESFKFGTVGKPLKGVQIKIAPDGEIWVRSKSLFAGYKGLDPSACDVDIEGWLHTGDIGEFDEEGFLKILGRKKNIMINSLGRNIHPEAVEKVYRTQPQVLDAVIFGDRLPQVVGVIITSVENHDELQSSLAEFALPLLPEICQIKEFHFYSPSAAQALEFYTLTGRPQRQKIWNILNSKRRTE